MVNNLAQLCVREMPGPDQNVNCPIIHAYVSHPSIVTKVHLKPHQSHVVIPCDSRRVRHKIVEPLCSLGRLMRRLDVITFHLTYHNQWIPMVNIFLKIMFDVFLRRFYCARETSNFMICLMHEFVSLCGANCHQKAQIISNNNMKTKWWGTQFQHNTDKSYNIKWANCPHGFFWCPVQSG